MGDIGAAHARHQFAAAIAPSFTSHLGSEASTGTSQQLIARQDTPRVGDGVVGEHVLAEAVPLGLVAQVEAVLLTADGTEEDVVVDSSKEKYVAVARCGAGAADDSVI